MSLIVLACVFGGALLGMFLRNSRRPIAQKENPARRTP